MHRLIVSFGCFAGACLVWALVASAAPTEPRGKFQGKTGQGRHVAMRVGRGHLDMLRFTIQLRCRDGSLLVDEESDFEPTALRHGGSFRDVQVGSTDEVWFRGQVDSRRIHGRVRVTDRIGQVRCNSRWVSFNARSSRH
jgi:hypothetical protein